MLCRTPPTHTRSLSDLVDGVVEIDVGSPLRRSLVDDLVELCRTVEGSAAHRVVALRITGLPEGVEEPDWPGGAPIDLINKWERALRRFERVNAITLAVAGGVCAGPGLNALLSADYRIGRPDLRLAVAATSRYLWPGMAVHRLVRQVGVANARKAVLFGFRFSAPEALEIGLLDQISDDIPAAVADVVGRTAGVQVSELAVRRQLVLDAGSTGFEESLGAHLAACDRVLRKTREGASG